MPMKSLIAMGVGLLLLVLHPGPGWTQTSDERMRQLEQELSRMRQDIEALRKEQAEAAKQPAKLPIELGASITVRYDLTEVEDQLELRLDENRDGFRTRDRFWAEFRPDGPVNAGIRLSTGENPNPTSPFIRFGDLGRSKSFNLDQFWLAVRPIKFFDTRPLEAQPADVALLAGRMPQPFWRGSRGTWSSELIWDDDVSPEGFVVKLNASQLAPGLQLQATAGYFVIEEVDNFRFAGLTGNTFLAAGQVKAEYKPVAVALALYGFNRLNAGLRSPNFTPGVGAVVTPGQSALLLRDPGLQRTNNRIDFGPGAEGFVEDTFNILNFTGQLYYPLAVMPQFAPEVFLVGDYARNLSVDRDRTGYGITVGLRGGGKPGSGVNPYNLWLTYRNVDADATLATVADSDLGNGTSYRGIEAGVNYRLHKHLLLQISGFAFNAGPHKDIYWRRVFFDVVANF